LPFELNTLNGFADAIAYLSMNTLLGQTAATSLISDMEANKNASATAIDADSTVRAGFAALYGLETQTLMPSEVGAV
jgi:hypothetical protein